MTKLLAALQVFQIYKTPRLRRGVLVPKSCCS